MTQYRTVSNGAKFAPQRLRKFWKWSWWVYADQDFYFYNWNTFPGGTPAFTFDTREDCEKWLREQEAKRLESLRPFKEVS